MPWTKPITGTETARIANADLEIRLFFGDAAATPPSTLRWELLVKADQPDGSVKETRVDRALTASSLTPAQRTTLAGLLTILRDDGFVALEFVNS